MVRQPELTQNIVSSIQCGTFLFDGLEGGMYAAFAYRPNGISVEFSKSL
jgi:hypothetical protein